MTVRRASAACALVAVLAMPAAASAAVDITRVSVAGDGAQSTGTAFEGRISADGRTVAFSSIGTDLVPGDTNNSYDVFVHDLASGVTERVSLARNGAELPEGAYEPAISADGRTVAFQSYGNAVPGDTDRSPDVFVHRAGGELAWASEEEIGGPGAPHVLAGYAPSISADGRLVTFEAGVQLPSGISRSWVAIRDLATQTTRFVSLGDGGDTDISQTGSPSISGDGSTLVFYGRRSTTDGWRLYVLDIAAGEITQPVPGTRYAFQANLSHDGRYVGFASIEPDLVPGDTNGRYDIFVLDRQAGAIERATVAGNGSQLPRGSADGAISPSGKTVVFAAEHDRRVYVRDLRAGTTEQVDADLPGQSSFGESALDLDLGGGVISADDRRVAFSSTYSTLVEGDTNETRDVFVADRLGPAPRVSVEDVSTQEGNTGSGEAVFTVSLAEPAGSAFSIRARTADGSATAGSDYEAVDVAVTFEPGERTAEVPVPVRADTLVEPDEDFRLILGQPSRADATIERPEATGTILNDDRPPPCRPADGLIQLIQSLFGGPPPRCAPLARR